MHFLVKSYMVPDSAEQEDIMTYMNFLIDAFVILLQQVNGTEADYEYEEITLERVKQCNDPALHAFMLCKSSHFLPSTTFIGWKYKYLSVFECWLNLAEKKKREIFSW